MNARLCVAAVAVCCLAVAADDSNKELDRLKMAGAGDDKIAKAMSAYESLGSKPPYDAVRRYDIAVSDARQDVVRKRLAFIHAAQERLGKNVNDKNIALWNEGQQTDSILDDNEWISATDRVFAVATSTNEKSSITFKTLQSGANIRYLTLKEDQKKRPPHTAFGVTNHCKENLTPAGYYVWAERYGKATSPKREYDIIEAVRTLTVVEDQ